MKKSNLLEVLLLTMALTMWARRLLTNWASMTWTATCGNGVKIGSAPAAATVRQILPDRHRALIACYVVAVGSPALRTAMWRTLAHISSKRREEQGTYPARILVLMRQNIRKGIPRVTNASEGGDAFFMCVWANKILYRNYWLKVALLGIAYGVSANAAC